MAARMLVSACSGSFKPHTYIPNKQKKTLGYSSLGTRCKTMPVCGVVEGEALDELCWWWGLLWGGRGDCHKTGCQQCACLTVLVALAKEFWRELTSTEFTSLFPVCSLFVVLPPFYRWPIALGKATVIYTTNNHLLMKILIQQSMSKPPVKCNIHSTRHLEGGTKVFVSSYCLFKDFLWILYFRINNWLTYLLIN